MIHSTVNCESQHNGTLQKKKLQWDKSISACTVYCTGPKPNVISDEETNEKPTEQASHIKHLKAVRIWRQAEGGNMNHEQNVHSPLKHTEPAKPYDMEKARLLWQHVLQQKHTGRHRAVVFSISTDEQAKKDEKHTAD